MPRGLRAWCKLPVMKAMMLTQLVSRQGVRVPCKERETTGKCFKRVPFLTACIYVWAQAINHRTDPVTRNGMHVARFTMHYVFSESVKTMSMASVTEGDIKTKHTRLHTTVGAASALCWLKHLSIMGQTVCFSRVCKRQQQSKQRDARGLFVCLLAVRRGNPSVRRRVI